MAENGDDLSLDGFDTDDDSLSFDDMDLDSGMSEESVIGFDDGSTQTSSDSDEFESLRRKSYCLTSFLRLSLTWKAAGSTLENFHCT